MSHRNDVEQETLQSAQKTLRPAGKIVGKAGKKILSSGGKKLLAVLAPYLPAILIILAILLLLWFIVGAILSGTPQGQLLIGPEHTQQDEELVKFYNDIKDKNNKRDKWLVSGEKESGTWHEEINTDIVIEKFFPEYKDKILTSEDIDNIAYKYHKYYTDRDLMPPYWLGGESLKDYYNRDAEYLETFGLIHSGSVWHILTFNEEHSTERFKEMTGIEFRPFLYYKSSSITITYEPNDPEEESSTTVIPLYLIVEGNGLHDHQTYHYEWRTEIESSSSGTTTTTWEELVGQTSIRNNPWQRLDDWVQEKYEINKRDEIEIARLSVWEAGIGYTEATERLEWLFSTQIDNRYLSQSFVPDNIMSAFHAAEDIFGIPSWFLAALAMKESSLNPEAYNKKSGAFGLFQLTEGTRKTAVDTLIAKYSDKLPPQLIELYNNSIKDDDFYKQALKDPYINTLAGSLVFIGKCTNNNIKISDINWDGNWLEQILPALTDYGGYLSVPEKLWSKYGIKNEDEAKLKENRQKWCRDEYASVIGINAKKFQIEKVMPVDGIILADKKNGGHITDHYGQRKHPVTGKDSFHTGIDLAFVMGTPIRSVAPGTVEYTGYDRVYGNMVIIDHGTFKTRYAHASSINVRTGEFVNAGKMVARVGNTGLSTGSHLHFEVHAMDSTGHFNHIDPLIFLAK